MQSQVSFRHHLPPFTLSYLPPPLFPSGIPTVIGVYEVCFVLFFA